MRGLFLFDLVELHLEILDPSFSIPRKLADLKPCFVVRRDRVANSSKIGDLKAPFVVIANDLKFLDPAVTVREISGKSIILLCLVVRQNGQSLVDHFALRVSKLSLDQYSQTV